MRKIIIRRYRSISINNCTHHVARQDADALHNNTTPASLHVPGTYLQLLDCVCFKIKQWFSFTFPLTNDSLSNQISLSNTI